MEYVVTAQNLRKKYKKYNALNDFSMNVPKGSIYGFVGKNGAGKTTLIRLICGLQRETSGEYTIFGVTSQNESEIAKARSRMGAVVETPSIYQEMTARENLKAQYRVLGMPDYEGIDELLKLVGLEDTGNKKAKSFSLGMKQRLGIAVALCGQPDLLVLDEPINGLDPEGIISVRELILKLNREHNITIIISSHILDELSKLATWYGFIDSGRMVEEMSAEELENKSRKSIRVTVSDILAFARAMDSIGAEYSICSDNSADIFSDVSITELVHALEGEKCELSSVTKKDETLENFYMNLVGGDHNE